MAGHKIYPSLKQFIQLSRRGNVIPVCQEILADFETPLSAYLKLRGRGLSYLLESVEQGEKLGRYSFLGSAPSLIVESRGSAVHVKKSGSRTQKFQTQDPLRDIEKILSSYKTVSVEGLPRFSGGFVGFAGYDIARFLEPVGAVKRDTLHVPDSLWMLSDTLVIFDHLGHVMKVVANGMIPSGSTSTLQKRARTAYHKALTRINHMVGQLQRPLPTLPFQKKKRQVFSVSSNMSRFEFLQAVRKAKKAIRDGETIQVVLSQRFSTPFFSSPFEVYRALRSLNPSPYMFYLDCGSFTLVGSSPEILVRCEDGRVETRPIAGTRRRGKNDSADARIEEELRQDPKERAEHLMLADLGRNDIGRVCEYGSVQVNHLMSVEKYSHVMHLVSSVVGTLQKGKNAFDVLRAAFPAGTVTGAPKVRAMQIINELEPDKRGPYAGAVGYIGFNGNMDTCITIRTILIKNGKATVQAGAGIVADSRPEKEFQETRNKAAGMLEAIRRAEQGL